METRPTSPTSPSKTRSGPSSSLVWENGAGAASRTDFELKTDVLVLGGGAIGAATAYFLRLLDPGIDVTVVERAPTYKLASTPRASGDPASVLLARIEHVDRRPGAEREAHDPLSHG